MKVSLIVTTYNWPEALKLVLKSALNQDYQNYEIIIADDGSDEKTKLCIEEITKLGSIVIKHAWHEDLGFRAAQIRNKAVSISDGEYLIFIDGDCILPHSFITDHVQLSQSGFFVPGSRLKLSQDYTNQLITSNTSSDFRRRKILELWLKRKIKRVHPIFKMPADSTFRFKRKNKWQGAVTCNLSLWRKDFFNVNGFNNDFIGWGLEDSDLVIRLMNNTIYRKDGKFYSYVIHLHHKEASRFHESQNYAKFQHSLKKRTIRCTSGVNIMAKESNELI